ncbi:LysM peptidoglycan-binding domain-containing protein [Xanthomonas massiliensis]|uniref:LysM peptidoglycan-binding domain-containing protein n=1 Tax=Xanthomonas massiliensis TaxID=1720302 RepID=UPI000826B73E|nr:LysM peptidoglycan-binding domain-containing protein [Xanthomonas massiliensis]
MFKRLRTVVAVAALTVATYAAATTAGEHPDTYVVRKGDTLWGIAGRFLGKPWLWPEIWQANPQVANPHLIYPGDVLSLAYLDRVAKGEIAPGPRQEAPIDAIPLAEVEPFLKNLSITDESFRQLPYVVGLEDNRLRASAGQLAYVANLHDARPGQRYAVVRPTVRYAHPRPNEDLNADGSLTPGSGNLWKSFMAPDERHELLGYELAQVNVGTIVPSVGEGLDSVSLRLEDSGREVRAGDRIVPVQAHPYDLQFIPHPPSAQALAADGRVLAVADTFTSGGPRDVIALSVGARDGVDNGTVFSLWNQSSYVNDRVGHHRFSRANAGYTAGSGTVKLPEEYAAHAMVFRTFDKVSYALVMKGVKPVKVGYQGRSPDDAPLPQ